jgi:hypothetical protein
MIFALKLHNKRYHDEEKEKPQHHPHEFSHHAALPVQLLYGILLVETKKRRDMIAQAKKAYHLQKRPSRMVFFVG